MNAQFNAAAAADALGVWNNLLPETQHHIRLLLGAECNACASCNRDYRNDHI